MVRTLDSEIQKYLPLLGNAEKKSLLSVIKSFLSLKNEASELDEAEETEFEKEMLRRIDDYEHGRIKTYTHDELVAHARNSFADHQKSLKSQIILSNIMQNH